MALWLKQSTAVDLPIGPFVSDDDAFTPETGLTITQPDIRLKKNGAAWAQKNAAQTLSHEENGWYEVSLDTTDTDTLGHLLVAVYESGALACSREFMVVPAMIYDAYILGTDRIDVNVTHAADTAWNSGGIGANTLAADTLTAAKVAADVGTEIGTAVWATAARTLTALDEDSTTMDLDATIRGAVGMTTNNLDSQLSTIDNLVDTEITALQSDVTAIKAKTDNLPSDPADASVIAGLIAAAEAKIDIIDNNVDIIVTDTSTDLPALIADLPTNAELATALGTADDAVLAQIALVKAKTDNLPTDPADASDIAAAFGTVNSTLATIASYIDTEVAAILGHVDTEIASLLTLVADIPTNAELATALGTADDAVLAAIAALNNLSAATVKAQVVAALATDTYAEPGQGVPTSTIDLATKIGHIYKQLINEVRQTASQYSVMNSAGTVVDQKAAVSDDGTTFTRAKIASGP